MDMPKPAPEHAALNIFAGTWKGTETMPPSQWAPVASTAEGHIVNASALGGFAIVQDYVQKQGAQIRYQGHGVFTWEPQTREYRMYWFDSMGSPVNLFRGGPRGSVWTFESREERGITRSIWEFTSASSYRHKMEMSPDGQYWTVFMEGVYGKTGG